MYAGRGGALELEASGSVERDVPKRMGVDSIMDCK